MEGTTGLLVELSVILFNMASLVGFTALVVTYVNSKPVLFISIIDLLNKDLSLAYCCFFTTACTIHLLISLNLYVRIPESFAALMSFLVCFWAACFVNYLTVGVIVHFILVYKGMASISEAITDESLRNAIRAFVGCFSAFMFFIPGLVSDLARAYPLYHAMLNQPEEETAKFSAAMIILIILAAIALATNVTLRILIRRARVGGLAGVTTVAKSNDDAPPYAVYIFMILALGCVGAFNVLPANRFTYDVKRFIVMGVFCVVIPLTVILCDKKLKNYAQSKMSSLCPGACLSNRVEPVV